MTVSLSQPTDSVIQVTDLSKSYGDVRAVDGLTFHVGRGEIFGFLGPNGAGKTTTLLLTTHYMEEAEALCDRIGIIDVGKLVALDTPGALINTLAGVSSITTSAYLPLDAIRSLPSVTALHRNGARLDLQTGEVATTLRTILDLAEQHKVNLNDLHIKQPNLEDVFLNLTGRTIRA